MCTFLLHLLDEMVFTKTKINAYNICSVASNYLYLKAKHKNFKIRKENIFIVLKMYSTNEM